MDLTERLHEIIDRTPNVFMPCTIGYLQPNTEGFCVYPLAGSRVSVAYMDGTKEQEINYEIVMKSNDLEKINHSMWQVQNALSNLKELESFDDSFEFEWIEIANAPHIQQLDEKGAYLLALTIKVKVLTNEEE